MNKNNKFEALLANIQQEDLYVIDKFGQIIAFIRPAQINNIELSLEAIDTLIKFFNEKNAVWSDKNVIYTGKASAMKGIIWMTNDMVNLLSNAITIVGLLALLTFCK